MSDRTPTAEERAEKVNKYAQWGSRYAHTWPEILNKIAAEIHDAEAATAEAVFERCQELAESCALRASRDDTATQIARAIEAEQERWRGR